MGFLPYMCMGNLHVHVKVLVAIVLHHCPRDIGYTLSACVCDSCLDQSTSRQQYSLETVDLRLANVANALFIAGRHASLSRTNNGPSLREYEGAQPELVFGSLPKFWWIVRFLVAVFFGTTMLLLISVAPYSSNRTMAA